MKGKAVEEPASPETPSQPTEEDEVEEEEEEEVNAFNTPFLSGYGSLMPDSSEVTVTSKATSIPRQESSSTSRVVRVQGQLAGVLQLR